MLRDQTTAKISFEIEIDVSGSFQPGYPASGPTYSSGGEPGAPDVMEDIEITGIGYLKLVRPPALGLGFGKTHETYRYETLSLTEGVDMRSPDVQRLLANLLAIVHDDAELALLDEAREF